MKFRGRHQPLPFQNVPEELVPAGNWRRRRLLRFLLPDPGRAGTLLWHKGAESQPLPALTCQRDGFVVVCRAPCSERKSMNAGSAEGTGHNPVPELPVMASCLPLPRSPHSAQKSWSPHNSPTSA